MRETSARVGGKGNPARIPVAARSRMRQAERTLATRRKLLDAAKRIFARNGFEAARLEDIAVGAGYTRGAFYANFKSKEDIFFALLEEWVRERIDSFTTALHCHNDPVKKLAALRKHYAEQATDRRLLLISLEFKLFALRHPEAHARLRRCHRRIRATFGELLSEIVRSLGKTLPISNPAASACLGSVAQGLLLEHLVDPKTLSEGDLPHVLGLFFDSLFESGPSELGTGTAGHFERSWQ
jgi:AcrR family transcriptional regulator